MILFSFGGFGFLNDMEEPTPPITIGDMELDAVTNVTDSGGVRAPEKKAEKGFSWDSFVDSKPIEANIEAWVSEDKYNALDNLRSETEPVRASIDKTVLRQSVVEDLEIQNANDRKSHFKVTFTLREIREASTDTTTLTVETGNGTATSSASAERPSFVQSENDSTDVGDEVEGDSGDDGNFVSNAIGDAASAIGGLL